MATTYEVLVGDAAAIESTLKTYESLKDAHSLRALGFTVDGTGTYHVLVKYRT